MYCGLASHAQYIKAAGLTAVQKSSEVKSSRCSSVLDCMYPLLRQWWLQWCIGPWCCVPSATPRWICPAKLQWWQVIKYSIVTHLLGDWVDRVVCDRGHVWYWLRDSEEAHGVECHGYHACEELEERRSSERRVNVSSCSIASTFYRDCWADGARWV